MIPTPGLKKPIGRPCESCGLMSGNDTGLHLLLYNGRVFKTPSATCKAKNIVYCATRIYIVQSSILGNQPVNFRQGFLAIGHTYI